MELSIVRDRHRAVVRVSGDVVVDSAARLYAALRTVRRRNVREVVLDLADAGRIDFAGVAVVRVAERALQRDGKQLAVDHASERHRAALALVPEIPRVPPAEPLAPVFERIGARIVAAAGSARSFGGLCASIVGHSASVIARRTRLPHGSVTAQIAIMGAEAMTVVGLLGLLVGMTIAFQAAMQLRQLGAESYVGDMVGVSMVRELAPMMTAIMLTGRTGAAIAAELGTMRVGGELDALAVMGISPVRFLVVPRLAALTIVQPALTLLAAFIGIAGGLLVAYGAFAMAPAAFWLHVVARLELSDFALAITKSIVFAWVIGLAATHVGLRAMRDASAVGAATTRAVVVAIFAVVAVDAVFATATTVLGRSV